MTLRVLLQAERDIVEAVHWYEEREPGLGQALIDQIDAALQRIEQGPERYPIVYRQLRRTLPRRFPYAIYFLQDSNDIIVFAVLHQRRDQKILDDRLKE